MSGAPPARSAACRCSSSARRSRPSLIVPLTGDRGLAGAFNAQVTAARLRARARAAGARARHVRWLGVGKKGRSTLTLPPPHARRRLHRLHRRPGVRGRAGDRAPRRRALRRGRGRPGRARLQHVRLGADPDASPSRRSCRSPPTSSRPTRRSGATTRSAATSSSSPSRRRSSSGCCPSTSRRRSTARCSSRRPPSRGPG